MVKRIVETPAAVADESADLIKKNKPALTKCERDIERGESAYLRAAKAVVEIIDNKLFLGLYATKTAYFAQRWELVKQELTQYEQTGRVLLILEDKTNYSGDKLPTNGCQCRQLYRQSQSNGKFSKDRLVELWGKVAGGKDKITAKLIAEKAKEIFRGSEASDEQPTIALTTNREQAIPTVDEPTTVCSAWVTVKMDLHEALDVEYNGKVLNVINDGEYQFEVLASNIESLMHHLGTWATRYKVKEFVITLR